jgi:hypothetical protein
MLCKHRTVMEGLLQLSITIENQQQKTSFSSLTHPTGRTWSSA